MAGKVADKKLYKWNSSGRMAIGEPIIKRKIKTSQLSRNDAIRDRFGGVQYCAELLVSACDEIARRNNIR